MIEYPFDVDDECRIPKVNSIDDIKDPLLFPNIVKNVENSSDIEMIREVNYDCWYRDCKEFRSKEIKRIKRKKLSKMRNLISQKRSMSKKNNIPFDLDIEWYIARLKLGCELTKIPFEIAKLDRPKMNGSFSPYQPSIDRINPDKGYLKSNCRLILQSLNFFKLNFSDDHLYKISEQLIKHRSNPD